MTNDDATTRAILRAAAAADAHPGPMVMSEDPLAHTYITVNVGRGATARKLGKRVLLWTAMDALALVLVALFMAVTGINLMPVGIFLAIVFIAMLTVGLGLVLTGVGLAWKERHAYAKRKASE